MRKRTLQFHRLLVAFAAIAWSGLLVSVGMAQDEPKIKIACVGDSITHGARIENRAENNYPTQLGQILG